MKRILFVCIENSCRSQMAEGWARHLGAGVIEPFSAGSRPSGVINSNAVAVMQEADIDISQHRPKGFLELPFKEFDYVISLGCKDTCPFFPAEKHVQWQIADPKGKDIEFFRKARDEIKQKIEGLIKELKITED